MTEVDMVNNPPHYNNHPSGIEAITIIEYMPYNIGAAMKYLWRCDQKGSPDEDLMKAMWYIERELAKRAKDRVKANFREEARDNVMLAIRSVKKGVSKWTVKEGNRPVAKAKKRK